MHTTVEIRSGGGKLRPCRTFSARPLSRTETNDEEITQYHIASISGRWVLVLRILLEFADPTRLGLALGESQIFAFALANMDVEDYWPGFSCLQTFRASQETSG